MPQDRGSCPSPAVTYNTLGESNMTKPYRCTAREGNGSHGRCEREAGHPGNHACPMLASAILAGALWCEAEAAVAKAFEPHFRADPKPVATPDDGVDDGVPF